MNCKLAILETFAIVVCYVMIAWPLASAASVNVMFNGQVQETVEVSPTNLLNKVITSEHSTTDVTWSDIKIAVKISSASMSHTVSKIYLFKCKKMDPVSCAMTEPQVFDRWIDTELAWKDISEREDTSPYPQVANLLILIKMTGPNDRTSWVGSWDTVRRTEYNIFNTYSHEIGALDFHAKASNLVQPAKLFMETYQMIPFNWAQKVVFQEASSLFGLGASESELQSSPPQLQTAQVQSNEISTINKDYYFVISQTSSGKSMPVTLNLNPSFTCGDGFCETDLGEAKDNCCYDCGCMEGEYCDSAANKTGGCKDSDAITLKVQPLSIPSVTDCSVPFEAQFKLSFSNPPSSLPETVTAYTTLGEDVYTSSCTKGMGAQYNCPVTLNPEISCGSDSEVIGPNMLNVTVTYNDGPNKASREMSTSFPDFTVTYGCDCQSGFYCDAGANKCKPEGSIGLQIENMTSYITDYNPAGDEIVVTARINNPPHDLTTPGTAKYVLGSIYRASSLLVNGTSGTAQCSGGAATSHVYVCRIPIHITDYDHEFPYYYKKNTLAITATFSNGGRQMVKEMSVAMSDVTIPSYRCGDGTCNTEENQENCCSDCGCQGTGQYCDKGSGCSYTNNVSLSVISVTPLNVTDCKKPNVVSIKARVENVPSDIGINYVYYFMGGELKPWAIQCSTPSQVTGITDCTLQIPALEEECIMPFYRISPNRMNMSVSFPDGRTGTVTKHLTASFADIKLIPTWHCGKFDCESEFGESGENCCIDCGCGTGKYCDYDPQFNPNGQCREKSGVTLVIDSPAAPVNYDTCEKSQKLVVKAHLENQPSGMTLESWHGIIKGESTNMIVCQESNRFRTSVNKTFECQIVIPSVSKCSSGDEHLFDNNSVSFFISYTNGMGRREVQTLTGSLPPITMKQGIRSIYDITQDAMASMKQKLADTMEAMNDLLDVMDTCIQAMMIAAIAGIVGTLAIGFGGGKMDIMKGTDFGDRVKAMSSMSQAVTTSVKGICDMIIQSYRMMVELYDVEMDMIKMQMCLDLYQHDMDTGNCNGREQSCFSSIQSCINLGQIRSAMGNMESYMDSVGNDATSMTKSWAEFGEVAEETGVFEGSASSARSANMIITQIKGSAGDGNTPLDVSNPACNRFYTDASTTTLNTYKDWVVIHVSDPGTRCYPVVTLNGITKCEGKAACGNTQIQIDSVDTETTYAFDLYCFSSGKNEMGDSSKKENAHVKTHTVPVKVSNTGICGGSGTGGTTATTLTTSFLQGKLQEISNIEREITRIAEIPPSIGTSPKADALSKIEEAKSKINAAIATSTDAEKKNNVNMAITDLNVVKTKITSISISPGTADSRNDINNLIVSLVSSLQTAVSSI